MIQKAACFAKEGVYVVESISLPHLDDAKTHTPTGAVRSSNGYSPSHRGFGRSVPGADDTAATRGWYACSLSAIQAGGSPCVSIKKSCMVRNGR